MHFGVEIAQWESVRLSSKMCVRSTTNEYIVAYTSCFYAFSRHIPQAIVQCYRSNVNLLLQLLEQSKIFALEEIGLLRRLLRSHSTSN